MKLQILSTGSKGNCYILGDTEKLIIECGVNIDDIMQSINYDISSVAGCIVSHEHGDHAKSLIKLANKGIDIYATKGTIEAVKAHGHHRCHEISYMTKYKLKSFNIMPFESQHDAREPCGFIINHEELGNLLFLTDSYYCKFKFKNLNHIMIEANYRASILEEKIIAGKIPAAVYKRIKKSHFEIEDVKEFLKASELNKVSEIVLIHMSDSNSDANFKKEIENCTGVPTIEALSGICLNLERWI